MSDTGGEHESARPENEPAHAEGIKEEKGGPAGVVQRRTELAVTSS